MISLPRSIVQAPCLAAATITLAAFSVACSSSSTAPAAQTATAPAAVTETFSGSIGQAGTAAFPFTVSATGSVQVGLTSVAPLATMALDIDIGSWDGTTCTIGIAKNDHAKTGVTALSGTAAAGSYCVQVADAGNIPDTWTVTFTVQVTHP